MSTALAPVNGGIDPAVVERVLIHGDLRQLTAPQKVSYYQKVCESVGLNPLTRPFEYIVLNGKETFYAKRDATDQLRKVHGVSVQIIAREVTEDCYVVTARATMPNGRQDESIGAVPIAALKGEARANAMMKCETKAKRRVTLSICGLGMLDETEIETIPDANRAPYSVQAPVVGPTALAQPDGAARHERQPSKPNGGDSDSRPSGAEVLEGAARPSGSNYASSENTAPRPELPVGAVRIERIDSAPTKNKNVTKYFITLSTGEQVTTIKSGLAALCEQLVQENAIVTVETAQTKWGIDLVAVHRVMPEIQARGDMGPDRSEEPLLDEPPF